VTTLEGREQLARRRTAPFSREYSFAPHFLDLDGVALHYVDEGPRDAAPIVFVHGNPTWSFLWRHAIAVFAGRERTPQRCIALDHVGCGLSDKPQDYPYRLAQHVDNLTRLIDSLALSNITLVVHDWGGAIGMGYAVRNPQRIARLVVLNTAAFTGGRAPLRIRACRTPLLGPLAVRGFNAFARAATVMATEQPGGLAGDVKRGLLAPYDAWSSRIATLRFVQDIPLGPRHPSWPTLVEIERGLERVRGVPMCLIWGARDWCFTLAFLDEWRRRFPQAEVHIAKHAGHLVIEDAREDVLAWMESFFAAHPVSA
jgi:haloalkane dehalogenase